jgi:predicted transcriptional regulator
MITVDQIRAARGLIGWTQQDLARHANMTLRQIGDIERGTLDPRASQLAAIEAAFDQAGVLFLEVGDTRNGGRGVRLKSP